MEIRIESLEVLDETVDYVFIDNADGSQISMPKAVWDEQQKAAELGATL